MGMIVPTFVIAAFHVLKNDRAYTGAEKAYVPQSPIGNVESETVEAEESDRLMKAKDQPL